MSPKIRLVKVIVQPVFVLDDGENIIELEHRIPLTPALDKPNGTSRGMTNTNDNESLNINTL